MAIRDTCAHMGAQTAIYWGFLALDLDRHMQNAGLPMAFEISRRYRMKELIDDGQLAEYLERAHVRCAVIDIDGTQVGPASISVCGPPAATGTSRDCATCVQDAIQQAEQSP